MHVIRCPARILAVVRDDGLLEVKCVSSRCGAARGVLVFHYIDLASGELVETKKYQDPKVLFATDDTRRLAPCR